MAIFESEEEKRKAFREVRDSGSGKKVLEYICKQMCQVGSEIFDDKTEVNSAYYRMGSQSIGIRITKILETLDNNNRKGKTNG